MIADQKFWVGEENGGDPTATNTCKTAQVQR